MGYQYDSDNQFLCDSCFDEKEDEYEYLLPITNSPRTGVCGYDGELDVFEFTPLRAALNHFSYYFPGMISSKP